jgi:hypothetical protein
MIKTRPKLGLVLDSGAWSAFTQKTTINIDEYASFLKEKHHLFDACFNLDVIDEGQKSFDNWLILTQVHGLEFVVPVYHITTDVSFLKQYLSFGTKMIAIGAMSHMPTAQRVPALDWVWEEHLTFPGGMPRLKVHGFGVMGLTVLQRYPWWSVDSTSWVQFGRFGVILIPKRRAGKYIYDENPYKVFFSIRSPKMKDKGDHFDNFPPKVREEMRNYIKSMGFEVGESDWGEDGKERVIVRGARNDGHIRDILNLLYYQNAANQCPLYPWAFNPKGAKSLF